MADVSAEEQQKTVVDNSAIQLKDNDTWYLIPRDWWVTFCEYCGLNPNNPRETSIKKGGPKPAAIDYSRLLKNDEDNIFRDELSGDLVQHRDFELVHSTVFEFFKAWGYSNEFEIPRKVITKGTQSSKMKIIELYPVFLRIARADNGQMKSGPKKGCISHQESIFDLLKRIYEDEQEEKKEKEKKEDKEEKEIPEQKKQEKEEKEIPVRAFYLNPNKNKDSDWRPWRLMSEEQLHTEVDELEIPIKVILVDFKKDDKWNWFKDGFKLHKDFIDGIQANDVIDCRDHLNKWYVSKVLYVEDDLIKVHYNNTHLKWDEEIPKNSKRIAKLGTHTRSSRKNGSTNYFQRANVVGTPQVKGAVGLRNLGNTCFMNSTLQCLSNTPKLTQFFQDDTYKKEVNITNPLGWKGNVANSYADLIKEMWGSKFKTVAPVKFKRVIGEFQPRFSGYQQHDSSELLHFLLDGLHEDLNRVITKPTTEQVDSNGREDAVVAKESWDRHLKRNQSIIVDLCQGQLKSTVVCPDCGKQSITFDPYMFLSVPLPQVNARTIQLIYKSFIAEPIEYACKVPNFANIEKVKETFAKMVGDVTVSQLAVVEVFHNQLYKFYSDDERILSNEEVWIYQVKENTQKRQLFHKNSEGEAWKIPTVIEIPEEKLLGISMDELRILVKDCVSPFLKGGWQSAGQSADQDDQMYTIGLYPSNLNATLMQELSYDNTETVNLDPSYQDIAIGLQWNKKAEDRFIDTKEWTKDKSAETTSNGKKKTINLDSCFAEFTKKETLSEEDAWYCNECKKHQCAEKKMDLYSLPETLIIHLKRFHYDTYLRSKIEAMVEFPIEGLDMKKWIVNKNEQQSCVYNLFAVSNHFGNLGGGHYTAYAKNIGDKKWYNLDDSLVQPLSSSNQARTCNAYVLFYQRQS